MSKEQLLTGRGAIQSVDISAISHYEPDERPFCNYMIFVPQQRIVEAFYEESKHRGGVMVKNNPNRTEHKSLIYPLGQNVSPGKQVWVCISMVQPDETNVHWENGEQPLCSGTLVFYDPRDIESFDKDLEITLQEIIERKNEYYYFIENTPLSEFVTPDGPLLTIKDAKAKIPTTSQIQLFQLSLITMTGLQQAVKSIVKELEGHEEVAQTQALKDKVKIRNRKNLSSSLFIGGHVNNILLFAFIYLLCIGYFWKRGEKNHHEDATHMWIGTCMYAAHTSLSLFFIWLLKEKYEQRKANIFTIQLYTFFSLTHQYFPRISPAFAFITPILAPEVAIIAFNFGMFGGSFLLTGLAYLVYKKKYSKELEEQIITKHSKQKSSKEQSKTQLPPLLEMQKNLDFFYQN